MSQVERINYEELVAAYWEGLTTVLRGFRPAAEFLDMWVPDENHAKSILNLIEAAQTAGRDNIAIYIGPGTLRTLEIPLLQELATGLGHVHVEGAEKGIVFEVSNMTEWASFQEVPPVYRDKLLAVFSTRQYEGRLESEANLVLAQAGWQGITLMALIDPATHLIQKVSYQGATSVAQRGLLEALCTLLVGMTIQEASDHAVIYLEYELRDPTQKPPVTGIVIPQNAHSIFQLPLQLTRSLLAHYRQLTGYASTENFFDRAPSAAWLALTRDEKLVRLRTVLSELCSHLDLPASTVEIISLDGKDKVTIRFHGDFTGAAQQQYIMKLEDGFKQKIDRKLQLYTEEMKDLNIIRRL